MYRFLQKFTLSLVVFGIGFSTFSGIRVQFKDNDGTPISEWMRLEFKIINDGPEAFNLTNAALTYYYSDATNGEQSTELWSFLINDNLADASTIMATVGAEPLVTNGNH